MDWLERLANGIWNPWLLGGFLLVGGYVTLRSGCFQLFEVDFWLKSTLGSLKLSNKTKKGGVTQFQAMSTALASTIGTGSIAGVATAIFYGGPGAVFWMWVSALLGMMLGCVEKILAIQYREKGKEGWRGGPMYYIEKGMGCRPLAKIFAFFCICATLGGGNLAQANSIATALDYAFGWNSLGVGIATAVVTGCVILGGIGRIARVSQNVVPTMALLFIGGGVWVIFAHIHALPGAIILIFSSAFTPQSAVGGGMGYGMMMAMRYGVARGVFSNEAGVGSSAIAHAAAEVEEPAHEGMWGIFEVFIATIVVCTVTALGILVSGVYDPAVALHAIETGTVTSAMSGAPLSVAAFGTVMGEWGGGFVALCLLLFAFSSLLGWSYYGERCVAYLTRSEKYTRKFRTLFLLCIPLGTVIGVDRVWQIADIFNGLMAVPNLIALCCLTPEAMKHLFAYRDSFKG